MKWSDVTAHGCSVFCNQSTTISLYLKLFYLVYILVHHNRIEFNDLHNKSTADIKEDNNSACSLR